MLNFDTIASHLGWFDLYCLGPQAMADYVVAHFGAGGLYVTPKSDVVPYSDHFAFAAAGVPNAWLMRRNCEVGAFYHHHHTNTMDAISVPLLQLITARSAAVLQDLAAVQKLPFEHEIPEVAAAKIAAHWQEFFGGW
jgi:hypothetical protein